MDICRLLPQLYSFVIELLEDIGVLSVHPEVIIEAEFLLLSRQAWKWFCYFSQQDCKSPRLGTAGDIVHGRVLPNLKTSIIATPIIVYKIPDP